MDQRELVDRAKRGDPDAFARLVDPALARLDAAARLILRDPELARDAVQETLIRAWRSCRDSEIPTGSTPGCIASSSTLVSTSCDAGAGARSRSS